MIIPKGKSLNGIYKGEDVEKELTELLRKYRDITGLDTIYPQETKVRTRVDIPKGYNIPLNGSHFKKLPKDEKLEIADWWKEQKRRIKEGFEGMCGLQYKYYNFTKLHGAKGPTLYRRHDNWMYNLIEECAWGFRKPWGILELGRRRFGKTSRIACFAIEATSRVKGGTIMMTSKTEDDAQRILIGEKVQFQYDNLPYPLKPSTLKSSKGELFLGRREKDLAGNPIIAGRNSKIVGKSPKETAVEGSTLIGWIHDEAPKTPNFGDLVTYSLPALADADGFNREGFAYLTGVAGDFDKHGTDYIDLWHGAHREFLLRVFTPGWLGGKTDAEIAIQKEKDRMMKEQGMEVEDQLYLRVDEFMNEDIAHNIRIILEDRKAIMDDKEMSERAKENKIRKRMQQYPLTVEEALRSSALSKWDTDKLDAQITYLDQNPPAYFKCDLEWEVPGIKTRMVPKGSTGRLVMLEEPIPGQKYVSGADTFGFKQTDLGSKGVQWIYKLPNMQISPLEKEALLMVISRTEDPEVRLKSYLKIGGLPVALYISRDSNPRHFAEDMVKNCNWYETRSGMKEPCRVLVETEPSNAIDYLLKNYHRYVARSPFRSDKTITYADEWEKWGLVKKEYWLGQMMGEIGHYIDKRCGRIYFDQLLRLMKTYDETEKRKKHDEVDAFGNTLIYSVDPRIVEWNKAPEVPKDDKKKEPLFSFRRW